jgi:hypothetical protein
LHEGVDLPEDLAAAAREQADAGAQPEAFAQPAEGPLHEMD